METEERTFFNGLKVVEFASVLAGPAAGMFFAELGATVIKIENSSAGEMLPVPGRIRWKIRTLQCLLTGAASTGVNGIFFWI
jgi:crotonobetainyl-CoA:carnitine CoA-transferase CaiB-like acyl-CoA transferase